jgi:uncharacterized protein
MTMSVIAKHATELATLCRRFQVSRLDAFGSVTTAAFDPLTSDVDFVVEFTEAGRARAFDNYFGLKEALADLFGRRVDLVTRSSIRNPIFKAEIERTAEPVYAEAR